MLMAEKYFWMTEGLVASAIASHDTNEKAIYLCLHLPVKIGQKALCFHGLLQILLLSLAFSSLALLRRKMHLGSLILGEYVKVL